DVLVNNAGIIIMERRLNADGVEMTFAVNHLAYFLLTNLLLDKLKAAGHARIVSVASNAHFRGRFDPAGVDQLPAATRVGFDAYCNSKLCNVPFTYALARRI